MGLFKTTVFGYRNPPDGFEVYGVKFLCCLKGDVYGHQNDRSDVLSVLFNNQVCSEVAHPAQIWNNGNCKKLRIPEGEQDASRNRTQPGSEIQVLRL